jgi:serine/threonine protein kinase/WD40 repeat protein/tetratricopeptide (TPR) repeat protein
MSDTNSSAADPLGQIADEFAEAIRQGQRPSVEEFARRYPEHADEIREILPALVLMEKAKAPDDTPGQPCPVNSSTAVALLQQLGDYQILREVGRGGMGVVYEAQQLSLGRHVAIKVLPAHALLDPRQLGRFQREARAAARLHHTNIVPVFGVGEQDGLHYYVMQFIPGLGLDQVLDELRRLRQPRAKPAPTQGDAPGGPNNGGRGVSAAAVARGLLSGGFCPPRSAGEHAAAPGEPAASADVRAADSSATIHLPGQSEGSTLSESGNPYWQSIARVGVQVADALAHAAAQGVLHRDIKPSNLLLDETGNVWVTDFGLAKATSDSDDLTHTGDIVGTLRYMAPERFSGKGDLRSDVYSLGLTLYEMLTLRAAFDEANRSRLMRQVLHDDPPRPRKLNPRVPRDLETVVLKAIARDPAHRYQSPAAMADDLKRFLEDRPVRARRISGGERLWRWCRRNPLPASLLATTVLVFVAGFAGVSWQWREARTARDEEKSQRGRAEAAHDEAREARNAAARQAAGLLLDRGIEDARGGEPARALHLFVRALRALPGDDPEAAPLERAIRANLSAWAETVPALEHIFPGGPQSTDVSFTPDGELIAMAVGNDAIQCFRTDTGQPVGPPAKIRVWPNAAMEFAADGRSLWVAAPGQDNVVEPWAIHRLDPNSGRPIRPSIPSPGPVSRLAVTPDGRYLVGAVWGLHPEEQGADASAQRNRKWRTASILVWETASGRVVRKVDVNAKCPPAVAQRSPDAYLGLSPDGQAVVAWVQRGSDRFEQLTFAVDGNEPPSRQELPALEASAPWTLHFQPNLRAALAIKDGQLHRWSAATPGTLGPGIPSPFRQMLTGSAADGRSVVSPVEGRAFDTGAWPPRPSGARFVHPGGIVFMEHSPDGRFTATWVSYDGSIPGRLWRLPRPHSRPPLPQADAARQPERRARFDAALLDECGTSAILWSGTDAVHDVRILDVPGGARRATRVRHAAAVREVAFTSDGRYFATASRDNSARVWETASGRPAGPQLWYNNYVATVAFSPDGQTLAAGDYGPSGFVRLWDWRTGKQVHPQLTLDDIILNVRFSRDGRYLAVLKTRDWSRNPELLVWEAATEQVILRLRHHGPNHWLRGSAQFRPDSRAVASRDVNGVLRLWEVPSGKLLGERPLDGDGVMRFSPGGRVVAASANLGVRLLDAGTLDPLPAGYLRYQDPTRDVAFSPDGAFLLTAHESGSAQLWDVAARKPVGPPAVLLGPILAVAFADDGKTCVCVAADGTVRRWPVPAPLAEPDLARLTERVALLTGQRMDDNQGLDFVPVDDWRALRAKLVGEGSTALAPPRQDADWHDAAAADAEQDGDAYGATWHLDRLAALRPKDWAIPARRGRMLAAADRRDEADKAYSAACRLAPSPQLMSDWLRAAAADHEAAGRKETARRNLDRAIALTPDDWTLYANRVSLAYPVVAIADEDEAIRHGADRAFVQGAAERAAGSGNWKRAAALLASPALKPYVPMRVDHLRALACLKLRDTPGYREVCARIAKRLSQPGVGPNQTFEEFIYSVKAFALARQANDDWTRPLAWIDHYLARIRADARAHPEKEVQSRRDWHLFLSCRGVVLLRAGRFEEAAKALREGIRFQPEGGLYRDWLFLALAEHGLGNAEAAKAAAAKARATKMGARGDGIWEPAELDLLTAELDAALPRVGK